MAITLRSSRHRHGVVSVHPHGLEQTLASMKSRLQVWMIEMGQDLQLLAADLTKNWYGACSAGLGVAQRGNHRPIEIDDKGLNCSANAAPNSRKYGQ